MLQQHQLDYQLEVFLIPKNKSATKGAQIVPIEIPTIYQYIFKPNPFNILSKR